MLTPVDPPPMPFVVLHGAAGALDEIILLALGIGLIFAVFKLTRRRDGGKTDEGEEA